SGDISKAVVNGYNYRNIKIISPAIDQKEFQGKVEISDPNLKLSLNGQVRYTDKQQYNFKLDIAHANLSKLGFVSQDSLSIAANLSIDVSGYNHENISGSVTSTSSMITRGKKSLKIPTFDLKINRYKGNDEFIVSSEFIRGSIKGKIDYGTVVSQFLTDISAIFPLMNNTAVVPKRRKDSNFEYRIYIGRAQSLIALFFPKLTISEGTELSGTYNSKKYEKSVHLFSDSLAYDNIFIKSISVDQVITNAVVEGVAKIEKFQYDSIEFDNLQFDNFGKNGFLESRLIWDLKGENSSELAWSTVVKGKNDIYLSLKPSFFSLENYRWEITNEAQVKLGEKGVSIDFLNLERDKQHVKVFGSISYNDIDTLKVVSENISLNELSQLFKSEKKIEGFLSGQTKISTSGKNFILESDLTMDNLFLDGEEVGKVVLSQKWFSLSDKIDLSGTLFYKGINTMNFGGNYTLATDKLDLYLNFDKTDLRFLNAFLDPELVSDINGKLHGKLYVTGNSDEPHLSGKLNLSDVNALSGLTGVRYSLNGAVKVEKNVFEINHIPLTDVEGNEARLTATISHVNFDKINYDIYLDFDGALKGKNNFNRFLVLNTQYKDGEYYFGKAYGKGNMSISGSDKIVDVLVNVESMKGTNINFPMYGAEEFEENEDFISFKSKGVQNQFVENLRNYSGVNLEMNFIVNTNAEVKLIFDNLTGDQIEAKGFGELNMKLDPFYNLNVSGKYEITEGSKYNFAMGSFKQPFDIVPGST
ncbi:MAG: translocation/assembly module TamB domain-containing protein, partial [Bacteroidetes bacterium]|nr:translocation/assembly module TamB domain-containing protein [Bacteroidota bacterium]